MTNVDQLRERMLHEAARIADQVDTAIAEHRREGDRPRLLRELKCCERQLQRIVRELERLGDEAS